MPPDARHFLARSEALDAVGARRLRQSRDRRPCLHDLASSTAVCLLGFVAQTKKPVFRCRLRPRFRSGCHSCRPARAPPRQLTVDTRRPCTCNQRSSTRSHRTVDNSLITARSEYCSFLNLPLDECFVNTPPVTREVKIINGKKESEELKQVTKSSERQE